MKNDVQTEILKILISAESAMRYSEIQPPDVESDLFNYHLKYLVKKGLVEKKDNLYCLTEQGKLFVINEKLLDPLGKYTTKIKANVINFVLREIDGKKQVLFQTRKRQPFYGMRAMMGRSMNMYELPVDAAKRGLLEETGLNGEFDIIGILRIFFYDKDNNNIIDDCISHYCYSTKIEGELKEITEFGENYWIDIDDAIKIIKNEPKVTDYQAKYLEIFKTKSHKDIPFFYHEDKLIVDKI